MTPLYHEFADRDAENRFEELVSKIRFDLSLLGSRMKADPRGVKEISKYRQEPQHRTYRLLSLGQVIGAYKEGAVWRLDLRAVEAARQQREIEARQKAASRITAD